MEASLPIAAIQCKPVRLSVDGINFSVSKLGVAFQPIQFPFLSYTIAFSLNADSLLNDHATNG